MTRAVLRPPLTDVVIAGALCLAAQVEVWAPDAMIGTDTVDGSRPVLALTGAIGTLGLAARRTSPLASAAVVFAAYGAQGVLTTPTQGLTGLIALVLSAYSVAGYSESRAAIAGGAIALAGITGLAKDLADWTFSFALVAAAWTVGAASRRRDLLARLLRDRARELEVERDEAVASERARIARELHDIVSHRVTTMVIQAQVADAHLAADPARAREALRSIDEGGRQALGELRTLLGLLRTGADEGEREPQPGIWDVAKLVADADAAGIPVALHIEGEPYEVGAGASLAAYRVVQEALTNVLKHAGPAPTEISLRYADQGIELTIADCGGTGANGTAGAGHGLAGMQERVSVFGGTLATRIREEGGFEVRATFPRTASR